LADDNIDDLPILFNLLDEQWLALLFRFGDALELLVGEEASCMAHRGFVDTRREAAIARAIASAKG
jgi:hypothetical protein